MDNLTPNILVIADRTPLYVGGSGDQKILYTSYIQMANIYFCIINDGMKDENSLENWMYYFNFTPLYQAKQNHWRYEEFLKSFSMRQDRFVRSEKYLSLIADKVQEIIQEKHIQLLVFEQTGILMWSWYRCFSDKVKCILRIHDSHYHSI